MRILFCVRDLWLPEDDYDYCYGWDIGAKDSLVDSLVRRHMYTHDEVVSPSVPGKVEAEKWHDVKVEVTRARTRCYLDGKLVHDIEEKPLPEFDAIATREESTGDVLLKVVNHSGSALDTGVDLRGLDWKAAAGQMTVLTSASPEDENSVVRPKRVYPQEERLGSLPLSFHHTYPAYSLTILRLSQ
jgi:alpha-L-arabinofuranosidase